MEYKIPTSIVRLCEYLPDDFETQTPELKLHFLLLAADQAYGPEGKWILVDGSRTLLELITEDK